MSEGTEPNGDTKPIEGKVLCSEQFWSRQIENGTERHCGQRHTNNAQTVARQVGDGLYGTTAATPTDTHTHGGINRFRADRSENK